MSGSTIGGVVGGVIGFVVGGPAGAQWGWMIGSAVGGYVDPVKIKGPQLTDAKAQTSTVGGPIPFGYGIFATAGNVIWAGKLVETKKTERQGKGGGAKTTTYSYSRSYAIGICQGSVHGLLWIKRNGKKVWTSDPNASIEDRDYADKWAQKLTIYNGGEDQLPDSTIVASVGVGNVSAFRGLCYVVIEDDDLTEVAGAVPQYEFCVIATPPEAYLTTTPYPQYHRDDMTMSAFFVGASTKDLFETRYADTDSLGISAFFTSASTSDIYRSTSADDAITINATFDSASTKNILITNTIPAESLSLAAGFDSASTKEIVLSNSIPSESLSMSAFFTSASTEPA